MQKIVGKVTKEVACVLNIDLPDDNYIYIGTTNEIHMKTNHPEDYEKYGDKICEILQSPDFVRLNGKDGSIEYVKEYRSDNDYVKVAVRLSGGSRFLRVHYMS